MIQRLLPPVLIAVVGTLLYGGFLNNPIVFDDAYFLFPGVPEEFLEKTIRPYPRHLAFATLALSWKWFGTNLMAFRVASLVCHVLVGIALYYFLRLVRRSLSNNAEEPRIVFPALLAALVFVVHPVAVYGAAYLIQRSILLLTLFSVVSWIFLLRGFATGNRTWLWAGVGAYVLAILSKEHAVMVPAVTAALATWWYRSQSDRVSALSVLRKAAPMFLVQIGLAVLTILYMRGVIGSVYEISGQQALSSQSIAHAWPLSILNQGYLFFKYLFLWVVPNPLWMSVDMREPFAASFLVWPQSFGFVLFLAWPIGSLWLLWQGGRRGLAGFAMLAPWLLFATELTTVRIQEIFVLYRSYLWIAPAFVIAVVLERAISSKILIAMTVVVPLILMLFAWNRLTTFSHPLLLWDDAASLVEGREGLTGLERIYRNRGVELSRVKKYDLAIEDYTKAIGYNAGYSYAYNDRGAALLQLGRYSESLRDFDAAIRLRPDYPNSHAGRGLALEALTRGEEARESFRVACGLGWRPACADLERK